MRKIFFIIPAYNEAENIPLLVESIDSKMKKMDLSYTIVIVNDGSTDGTKELVESYEGRFPIVLINHPKNKNVGEVFRSGFKYVLERSSPGDVVITKEADNTSDISIMPAMLERIDKGCDVVLASCYAKGGGIESTTIGRLILSSTANRILRSFFPINGVRTYSSFYRAYKAVSLKRAFFAYENKLIEENGFVCMVEMLIKLSRLPIRIEEVPMVLRCDLRKGKSKMNKSQTIFAYFYLVMKEFKSIFVKRPDVAGRYKNLTMK